MFFEITSWTKSWKEDKNHNFVYDCHNFVCDFTKKQKRHWFWQPIFCLYIEEYWRIFYNFFEIARSVFYSQKLTTVISHWFGKDCSIVIIIFCTTLLITMKCEYYQNPAGYVTLQTKAINWLNWDNIHILS